MNIGKNFIFRIDEMRFSIVKGINSLFRKPATLKEKRETRRLLLLNGHVIRLSLLLLTSSK